MAFKRAFYAWLGSAVATADVLLLRYTPYDPYLLRFLLSCKIPVFTVHHTMEGPEIRARGGTVSAAKWVADEALRRLCLHSVRGIVSMTSEIEAYEVASSRRHFVRMIYPNGVLYDRPSHSLPDARQGTVPQLVFAASVFEEWHGLDLLLQSIASSDANFVLHLVGEVKAQDLAVAARDPRIVVHGTVSRERLIELSASAWLGLGSFALYRKGMTEACTLKVREYLRSGVPVAAGHSDVFPADFPFFRNIPPSIEKVVALAVEMRERAREDVSESARPFIDKELLLSRLYGQIAEVVSPSS